MIIDHGPFPVFRCKCGKEVWGVNYDRVVVCGCGLIMQCMNYDGRGELISDSEGDVKREEEPCIKGSSKGVLVHQREKSLVNLNCIMM